ncbi:Thioesterase/thiol ester dehydrase-isomerase [Fomitiporia mediterranea MF3/22]|uniref:Thioesterase/thiol ester dehydrase-isomerase n=1 Tax=Fomitiporia mediterranea (strain MF3/22) TaxID=694068 RepID=UPI00044086BF|nr:Thioesterase/thiol ester dehydrase-isomerase [Fomitiporia mediterranea MF3/22]EJD07767.1 Thioesterase/thiol ester dehydrase-isomerase [Fomitiporia mediterranea MF3/22]
MSTVSRFSSVSSTLARLRSSLLSPNPHRQLSLRYSTSHHHSPTHGQARPHAHVHSTHNRIKRSHALTAALGASCLAFTVGALYPPDVATLVSPRAAPGPPDPEDPRAKAYVEELEQRLQHLPLLERHRNAPDAHEWYETRPYIKYPEEQRINHLTAGALRGPGKLALPPVLRVKRDESESLAVIHFGRGLCGHDGVVHGGLIATILDESLGRLAIVNVPEKIAVTATLTVDYKAPTKADQFVVVRCRVVELKGRKAIVEGSIEDVNGALLARAKGLFVQPKYAKLLNARAIHKALGEPPIAAAELTGGDPVPADPSLDQRDIKDNHN